MGRVQLGGGWDSSAALVDGVWLERTARRADVEPWLRTETRLLPWLAPMVPLSVPLPEVVGENPLVVRHRMVPGEPDSDVGPSHGAAVGRFLRALHDLPADGAVALGVPGPERTTAMRAAALRRFRTEIVAMLPDDVHGPAHALCDRLATAPAGTLVHGDLGADHVLVDGGEVTGIIDWSDARIADPAKDLAWALYGAPSGFAAAVVATYGPSPDEISRAADWQRVGPFYEVAHGLDTGDRTLVASGRRGIVDRLATASGR